MAMGNESLQMTGKVLAIRSLTSVVLPACRGPTMLTTRLARRARSTLVARCRGMIFIDNLESVSEETRCQKAIISAAKRLLAINARCFDFVNLEHVTQAGCQASHSQDEFLM